MECDAKGIEMSEKGTELEDQLVYVKFENQDDECNISNFQLIGLDTNEPILRLGNKFFAGKWKNSPTTNMFFEQSAENKTANCFGESQSNAVNYVDKTRKTLYMTRILISPLPSNQKSCEEKNIVKLTDQSPASDRTST